MDRSFESVLSSFAPPVVGALAQYVYGYEPVPQGSEHVATDRQNAKSLAKALYTAIGIPMAACCFIYSFLYRTYPKDREHARMQALIESEMQSIGSDISPLRGKDSQLQSSEERELYIDEKTIIEMDYDVQRYDFDDEKTSIHRR